MRTCRPSKAQGTQHPTPPRGWLWLLSHAHSPPLVRSITCPIMFPDRPLRTLWTITTRLLWLEYLTCSPTGSCNWALGSLGRCRTLRRWSLTASVGHWKQVLGVLYAGPSSVHPLFSECTCNVTTKPSTPATTPPLAAAMFSPTMMNCEGKTKNLSPLHCSCQGTLSQQQEKKRSPNPNPLKVLSNTVTETAQGCSHFNDSTPSALQACS